LVGGDAAWADIQLDVRSSRHRMVLSIRGQR
jgi:hypothetical protein